MVIIKIHLFSQQIDSGPLFAVRNKTSKNILLFLYTADTIGQSDSASLSTIDGNRLSFVNIISLKTCFYRDPYYPYQQCAQAKNNKCGLE